MEVFQGALYVSLRSVDHRRAYVHAVDDGRSVRLNGAHSQAAVWSVRRRNPRGGADDGDGILLRSVYGRYLGASDALVCAYLPTPCPAATQEMETNAIVWRVVATGTPNIVLLHDACGRYLRANPARYLLCRAGVSVSTRGCLGIAMRWEVEAVQQVVESGGSLNLPIVRQSEWADLLAWACLLLPGVLTQQIMSWRIRWWVRDRDSGSASLPAATVIQAHPPPTCLLARGLLFARSLCPSWFPWSAQQPVIN